MRENKQLVVDKGKGDCLRACITSVLGLPNHVSLPNIDDENWYSDWYELLGKFGIDLKYESKSCWRNGYWIASVPSLNFTDVYHAIVMKENKIAFDPSTKKRYRKGRNLLKDNEIVRGGWFFEITDAELLPKLKEYSDKLK